MKGMRGGMRYIVKSNMWERPKRFVKLSNAQRAIAELKAAHQEQHGDYCDCLKVELFAEGRYTRQTYKMF
jgi:hypothetical protein